MKIAHRLRKSKVDRFVPQLPAAGIHVRFSPPLRSVEANDGQLLSVLFKGPNQGCGKRSQSLLGSPPSGRNNNGRSTSPFPRTIDDRPNRLAFLIRILDDLDVRRALKSNSQSTSQATWSYANAAPASTIRCQVRCIPRRSRMTSRRCIAIRGVGGTCVTDRPTRMRPPPRLSDRWRNSPKATSRRDLHRGIEIVLTPATPSRRRAELLPRFPSTMSQPRLRCGATPPHPAPRYD